MKAGFIVGASALALSGCGGGSNAPNPLASLETLAEYDAALADFDATYGPDIDGRNFADLAALPSSGLASFDGGVELRELLSSDLVVVGQMEAELDFSTDSLSGTADRFLGPTELAVPGALTLTGELSRDVDLAASFAIDARLEGTLQADASTDIDMDFTLDLFRPEADVLAGFGEGTSAAGSQIFDIEGEINLISSD